MSTQRVVVNCYLTVIGEQAAYIETLQDKLRQLRSDASEPSGLQLALREHEATIAGLREQLAVVEQRNSEEIVTNNQLHEQLAAEQLRYAATEAARAEMRGNFVDEQHLSETLKERLNQRDNRIDQLTDRLSQQESTIEALQAQAAARPQLPWPSEANGAEQQPAAASTANGSEPAKKQAKTQKKKIG